MRDAFSMLAALSMFVASAGRPTLAAPATATQAAPASSQPTLPPVDTVDTIEPRRISLSDALERAFSHNASAAIAQLEIARAQALLREARASYLPQLSGNATYTRLDANRVLQSGTDAATGKPSVKILANEDQVAANVTLNVPLVAPLAWTNAARARAGEDVARANVAELRRSIAAMVARAYLQIFTHRKQRDAFRRAKETAHAHREFALTRLQGGVGNALDETRAAQEEAADESQVETSELALTRDREALGLLLGADEPLDATDEVVLPSIPNLPNDAQATRDATRSRSDIAALMARRDAAVVSRDGNWANYAPLLSAVVQPFFQNPPSLVQPKTGWQAQLLFSLPLYDGGFRQGLARERAATLSQAEVALESALRQATSEVRTAWASVTRSDRALLAARRAAALAGRAAELAGLAYHAGATTNLELVDAQRRARDAEAQAELAADAAREARLDLLLASGRFPG